MEEVQTELSAIGQPPVTADSDPTGRASAWEMEYLDLYWEDRLDVGLLDGGLQAVQGMEAELLTSEPGDPGAAAWALRSGPAGDCGPAGGPADAVSSASRACGGEAGRDPSSGFFAVPDGWDY